MKFRKPSAAFPTIQDMEDFLRTLPAEFEIVPEGHVCVKWPEGVTRERMCGGMK